MKKYAVFLLIWLWSFAAIAQTARDLCIEKAKELKLVNISYQYGKVKMQNTDKMSHSFGMSLKRNTHFDRILSYNIQEIIIKNNTASFGTLFAGYGGSSSLFEQDIKDNDCLCFIVMPSITFFSFPDLYFYTNSTLSPSKNRKSLRHQLQHFTIWKTAIELMFKEIETKLTQFSLENIEVCAKSEKNCSEGYSRIDAHFKLIGDIIKKWRKIAATNHAALDNSGCAF